MTRPEAAPRQQRRPKRNLAASRRRMFAAFTILFPFLLLLILEGVLRALNVGPDLSLFMSEKIPPQGTTALVMNPGVKSRYFSRVGFSPATSPDYFESPKPAGTFRIFCLGGSTTVGYPYGYNASFSSFLRTRLRKIFPDRKIEVINLGMTATNSFTVNDIARELAPVEPDLVIVYDGHNEFYGALGIASHESFGASRLLTKAYLRLIHFRTFLIAREAFAAASGFFSSAGSSVSRGTMMERMAIGRYIPYGSDAYRECLTTFDANLRELADIAADGRFPVILGTQVSNLRDQPPFISAERAGLTPEARRTFDRAFAAGEDLAGRRQPDSALAAYRSAISVDSFRADAHFGAARSLLSLRQNPEARNEYRLARDYDQLRFRASTDFNNAILSVADGKTIFTVDMEHLFAEHSPDSIIGRRLIFEHLHPNSRGYFLMAKAYARAMRDHGILVRSEEWALRDTLDDGALWEARTVTELDERIAARRTEILTSGWPFRAGEPTVAAVSASDTLGLIVERVTRSQWDWKRAHEAAIDYYAARRDTGNMEREYRTIIDQVPYDVAPYLKLAKLYMDEGRTADLRRMLLSSLGVRPTVLAYRALGDLALQERKTADAIGYYEQIAPFTQTVDERAENEYLLALAYLRGGDPTKATEILRRILALKPGYRPASELLSRMESVKRQGQ